MPVDAITQQSPFEALMTAISDENLADVKAALEAGADVNARDEEGETPLMCAGDAESPDCVKMMLEAGADVEARNQWGDTPLIALARFGSEDNSGVEIARLLVEGHANVNAVNDEGVTALMYAARDAMENVVRLLIDNGGDIEMKDNKGKTVQDWAASAEVRLPESIEAVARILKGAAKGRQQEAYIKSTHQTAAQRQALLKKRRTGIVLKA
jgi:ankyrin repeat protein